MSTTSSIEGEVGFGIQTAKDTIQTTLNMIRLTRFTWTPDVVQDEEGEPEIGGGMDVSAAERYGYNGATFTGEGRCRPAHFGFILRALGWEADDGKFIIYPGVNDSIRVTDDGGGPVDVNILTGTGATLSAFTGYTAAEFAAGLKAVLDADTTLSQTYTVAQDGGDYKFDISHGGATLSLHWSHANCNMWRLLGYNPAADDTGATTYEADYASDWAIKHVFTPIASASSFPWMSILDKMNQDDDLDTMLYNARVFRVAIRAEERDVVRFEFEGRALNWQDAAGTETETAEPSAPTTPNTSKGDMFFPGVDYKLNTLNCEFSWAETVTSALTFALPDELIPGRRTASGDAQVYLGSEASGGLFRKAYYGSASGTEPSTTIVEQMLHALFQSGQAISGLEPDPGTATEDYYAIEIHSEESRLLTYPIEKSGDDPEMGGLTFQIHKGTQGYAITLTNNFATGYYDS